MKTKWQGFTLIEVLVVMIIISIVTGAALLTLTHHSDKQIESSAKQFAGLLRSAQEQAMLQTTIIGVLIEKNSYEFLQAKEQDAKGKLVWAPIDDELLKHYTLPDHYELNLHGYANDAVDDDKRPTPQILISTNGDITPFVLYLGRRGGQPAIIVKGEPDGFITQQKLS